MKQTELEQLLGIKAPKLKTAEIQFDGGTSCNVPRLGYGKGYGSFRINQQPIVRCEFEAMSANAAEINTLSCALEAAAAQGITCAEVRGDSQIALKWVHCKKHPKDATSAMFKAAIARLRRIASRFSEIKTQWIPRQKNVDVFGH